MPHLTTPPKDKEAPDSSRGLKLQTTMPEYQSAERPLAARARTSSSANSRNQFCSMQVDSRPSGDSVVTPPATPTQLSSLGIPATSQAYPDVLSPPTTPASHRRYSSTGSIFERRRSIGAVSWKGFSEGLVDKLSVDRYKGCSSLPDAGGKETALVTDPSEPDKASILEMEEATIRAYDGKLDLQAGPSGVYEEYGRGAWSVVYQAKHTSYETRNAIVVAVKHPLWQGCDKIIKSEAEILTYLQPHPPREGEQPSYIIEFLGFHESSHSLVLESGPLTLTGFSSQKADYARRNLSTRSMRDPVVGTRVWLHIAQSLVSGLQYLQSKSVVHGDIKPTNIIMRQRVPRARTSAPPTSPTSKTPLSDSILEYDPLFCDFSSSYIYNPESTIEREAAASTSTFLPPELLSTKSSGVATFSTDIYSLALTLITPAIGADVYAPAQNHMQALLWAKEGMPIYFAQASESGSRVSKGGVVERCLKGAIAKQVENRWGVGEWVAMIEEEVGGFLKESLVR